MRFVVLLSVVAGIAGYAQANCSEIERRIAEKSVALPMAEAAE